MSSSLGAWGVPDVGATVRRERILSLLARGGSRPAVLTGPPGSGKTIAAAHCASATGRDAVWIDAGGASVTADRVAQSIVKALGGELPEAGDANTRDPQLVDLTEATLSTIECLGGGAGICVVVDDLGQPAAEAAIRDLGWLARSLRRSASRMVITTRSLTGWPLDMLCDWEIVGQSDLALTLGEAEDFLRCAGHLELIADATELSDACGGHAAIFAVLASQAATHGVAAMVSRTVSLDAWLERQLTTSLASSDVTALVLASLLKYGSESELGSMGIAHAGTVLDKLGETMPLLVCSRDAAGIRRFRVHDLLDGFLMDKVSAGSLSLPECSLSSAAEILTGRGDLVRAAEMIRRDADHPGLVDWLDKNGRGLLSAGCYKELSHLVELTPVHELMASPRVLMLWADLSCEVGEIDEALAKCQAARSLAEHEGDLETTSRAISLSMQCLCRRQRFDDAERLSREVLTSPHLASRVTLQGEALLCLARLRLTRGGDASEATELLEEACRLTANLPAGSHVRYVAATMLALVPALSEGDWLAGARILSPLVSAPRQVISSRVIAMGNLGLMLVEAGRLSRSRSLLTTAVDEANRYGLTAYVGAYSPPLGCAEVGAGEVAGGIARIRAGILSSESQGEDDEAKIDRVYLSTALRVAGALDDSLDEAERAFESLSARDNMGFRRLAALEVAASLLALGDASAARAWTESIASEGPPPNSYHRLRADMILSEADRREGSPDKAVKRLSAHKTYILSENANWQIAMYCRAFPELLGVFALAVGANKLPSHMLRMIMPEHAEVTMIRTKGFMDDAAWRELGARLLGDAEFARFIARDGLPLCHVRMFGGLEVSIGERSVRERDWRKRKARLLFTMLMIRSGQDVSRDQIFEHLWPGMDEPRAKSNLYVIWSAMKSVLLGDASEKATKCPYVESIGGVCRSVRETVRTDVDAFESASSRAREAEARGSATEALQAYRQIADLYRGDLLPGDCYDDWFANLREHYRSEFMDAMLRATELLLDAHDPHTALIFVRRAIQHDQFREDLYQAAVRCQIAAGQRSSAIDTYMQCRDKLCEELGLDPSAEMRALYDEILAMEERPNPVDFDPLAD